MEKKISDPRQVLKATAPKASRSMIYRSRLGLHQGSQADSPVICVQAAAGYGKSSLLLQWRREALESGALVAWLTLDEHDDGTSFIGGLNAALSIGSGTGKFVYQPPESDIPSVDEIEALTVWLAEVAAMAVEVVLILDDVHTLPPATASGSLLYLLLNAPANLKVILAYRRPIAANFFDLLASGRLQELRAEDLALSLEETIEVLESRLGNAIDRDACVRLYELTEGWPFGVQLAVSSILKGARPQEAITEFSARSSDLQHYFIESLVERLPQDVATFLTHICCLQRVHPDLCQAVTENPNSASLLEFLRDETPLFRDETGGDWMRIHPIARDTLASQCETVPAEQRQAMHTRAAQWLAEHEMFEEAAEHALSAGDREFAYDLIERCLHEIVVQGRVSRVMDWLQRLPPEEIERRPQIRIAIGWALAQSDRHAEAAALVVPLLDDGKTSSELRCEAAMLCGAAEFFTDDLGRARDYFSPWEATVTDQPVFQRILGTNLAAALELFNGKPQNANYQIERLQDLPWSPEMAYPLCWSGWISGFAYLWEGQPVLAEEVLRRSLPRAESASGRRSPIAVMIAATLAAVLWERELFDEAEMLLAGRLDILERLAPPDAIIHGYVTAARLAAARGERGRAQDMLEHLRAIGDSQGLPRVVVTSQSELIRMASFRYQESTCTVRLERILEVDRAMASSWGELQPIVDTQIALARVYTAIAGHRWDIALPILEEISPVAQKFRLVRETMQLHLLLSLARQQEGEDVTARLREVASLTEARGLKRLVADTHPTCIEQIQADTGSLPAADAEPLSAPTPPPKETAAKVVESNLLTPKEAEVLQLLVGNLTNKQIAAAMGVGDQTIKWHLKNMFTKLQAGSRKHLIGRARMLGILD
jgi:LuxR family transcriptional regulator, maltose regulon positive regulatory protein